MESEFFRLSARAGKRIDSKDFFFFSYFFRSRGWLKSLEAVREVKEEEEEEQEEKAAVASVDRCLGMSW